MFYILILRNWIRINILRITNPYNTLRQITNLPQLRTSDMSVLPSALGLSKTFGLEWCKIGCQNVINIKAANKKCSQNVIRWGLA